MLIRSVGTCAPAASPLSLHDALPIFADRFFAAPSTKAYAAVSVLIQLVAERTGVHPVADELDEHRHGGVGSEEHTTEPHSHVKNIAQRLVVKKKDNERSPTPTRDVAV